MAEQNNNLFKRCLSAALHNPIATIVISVILYCLFQAFILGNTPWLYKTIITGIIGIWIFMFIAKHLLKLILLIIAATCVFFGYAYWSNQDKRNCEAEGKYWNAETKICEEKKNEEAKTWLYYVVDFFKSGIS